MTYNTSGQDTFFGDYKVYVEGVEIPFENISVSNNYKQSPTATVTIPPYSGFGDIGRNYNPKIYIFYRDFNQGISRAQEIQSIDIEGDINESYKVLFSGIITGVQETKSVDPNGGNRAIQLSAEHHSKVLSEILVRFGKQTLLAPVETQGAISQVSSLDHSSVIHKSLESVEDARSGDRATKDSEEFSRLKGTPGVMKVYWEKLLKVVAEVEVSSIDNTGGLPDADNTIIETKTKSTVNGDNEALIDLYKPLVEEGIKFWDRLSGHHTIEETLDLGRKEFSKGTVAGGMNGPWNVVVPSKFRTFLGAQAETAVMVKMIQEGMQAMSPESSSYKDHFQQFLDLVDYEMVVLNSPTNKHLEYIVKPSMPHYYAPICNVLLPNMYHSISIGSDFSDLPTRVMNIAYPSPGGATGGGPGAPHAQTYTAPHSVRVGRGDDLKSGLGPKINKVGKYEWGSGIRSRLAAIPDIYNYMGKGLTHIKTASEGPGYGGRKTDDKGPAGAEAVSAEVLNAAKTYWDNLYPGEDKFNPFSDTSGITDWNRLLFLFSDQQFTQEISRHRTANIEGLFNPHAVVGYPMDVVDPSPSGESYHGLCISVNHNISANGHATTNFGIAAATTISELHTYKPMSVAPALAATLGFEDSAQIYNNPRAYEKACAFYHEVLGVAAAEPALLQSIEEGVMRDFRRDGAIWTDSSQGPMLSDSIKGTVQNDMLLTARNILSLQDLIDEGEEFIHIRDWAYVDPFGGISSNSQTESIPNPTKSGTGSFEANPYLSYEVT